MSRAQRQEVLFGRPPLVTGEVEDPHFLLLAPQPDGAELQVRELGIVPLRLLSRGTVYKARAHRTDIA